MKPLLLLLIALLAVASIGAQCSAPRTPTPRPTTRPTLAPAAAPVLPAAPAGSPTPRRPTQAATPQSAAKGKVPWAAEGTLLRKIQDRGQLIAAVRADVPTFGYRDPATGRLEGFDVDLVKTIANYILGDPDAVELKPVLARDRIQLLQTGQVDLVAATMTINADRAPQVDFSDVYYVAGQSLLVPGNSPLGGAGDLKGKNVCTIKGSTSEDNIRKAAPEANIILYDTDFECVAALDAGRVDGVTHDDAILLGYIRRSPGKYKIVGQPFSVEPYGIAVAQGQPELLDAVDAAIREMKASGEWARLYQKDLGVAPPAQPPPADWREVVK